MNTQLMIPLVLTAMVAVIGWVVIHHLSASRDRVNKRREKLTEFLIDAYRRIEKYPCRQLSPDNAADFELAIADVQLFGSPHLVQLA